MTDQLERCLTFAAEHGLELRLTLTLRRPNHVCESGLLLDERGVGVVEPWLTTVAASLENLSCECCDTPGFNTADAHVHGYPMGEICRTCKHTRREHAT